MLGIAQKTYMVGGNKGVGLESFFGGTSANPMRSSKNGKTVSEKVYQDGDKKDD